MKSNVIMQSPDRELFGVIVRQQTKDSFVSVSDLQSAYNKARWQYGWSDKRVNDILSTDATKERIYHLLNERGLIKTSFSAFTEMVENEGIVKCLKGLQVWKTTGRGNNKAVYCDPYIWVLLAMELNPLLYAKVVIWITDTLIFDRIEAGAAYKPMNEAIGKIIHNPEYYKYAKYINEKVFGKHFTGMRQLAAKHELQKITRIETLITDNIHLGFIKNEQDILKVLNNIQIG
jgi:hypothetical protein